MRKLMLCSFFKNVANLVPAVAGNELAGKTVTFIPTACVPEKVDFFVKSGRKALERLGLAVEELELTTVPADAVAQHLRRNDIIYVTGGNTFSCCRNSAEPARTPSSLSRSPRESRSSANRRER
jgi:dipeptidase E